MRARHGEADFDPVKIEFGRGRLEARLCETVGAQSGVVLVGGVGGGFDSPARGLYERLCRDFSQDGLSALRVRYRFPTNLDECVEDALAGIAFLVSRGVQRVGVVGHSLGGAVVVRAALKEPRVAAVVTLATQAYGTSGVEGLAPRPLLAIHGAADRVLPSLASVDVVERAREPKELVVLQDAGHTLDEAADEVEARVRDFLKESLRAHE